MNHHHHKPSPLKLVAYAIGGLCCLFISIGINRYAYTPLLPMMIRDHWFDEIQGGFIGATNFTGYFLGAYFAKHVIERIGALRLLHFSLIVTVASLIFCGIPLDLPWLYFWRLVAGVSAAFIMIAAPTLILEHIPGKYKGSLSGLMFSGIGMGIVFTGLSIPTLAAEGIKFTWIVLGLIAAFPMLLAWFILPKHSKHHHHHKKKKAPVTHHHKNPLHLISLLGVEYFCYGVGFTPAILFSIDYLTRHLHYSDQLGGLSWAVFGMGTTIGTLCTGIAADRLGSVRCLIGSFAGASLALIIIIFSHSITLIMVALFILGALFISNVSLTSMALSEMIPHSDYPKYWGILTSAFAGSVAISAYIMSAILKNATHGYQDIFVLALLFLLIGLSALICLHMIQHHRLSLRKTIQA